MLLLLGIYCLPDFVQVPTHLHYYFLSPELRHFKWELQEVTSLSLFSILFVQLCPQLVPVHQAATVIMRCLVMRSWASRLLLLRLVNFFLSSFIFPIHICLDHIQSPFLFSFPVSLFLFSPFLSHPLTLCILSDVPYPNSPSLLAVTFPLVSTLFVCRHEDNSK